MHRVQLGIAVALILVEAGVFAYLSEAWTIPICVTVLSLFALTTEWRFPLNPERRLVAGLAMTIPFTVQWAFAPYEPLHLRLFILYPLAHAGGQYGLALQTAYVWIKRPSDTWSALFPICGVCVFIAAGDVQTTRLQSVVFQICVLLFVLLMAAYYSFARIPVGTSHRRGILGRLFLSGLVVAITCFASVNGSRVLEKSWTTIERIYTEWMPGSGQDGTAGFSRQGRLGSISDRPGALDQVPVLRIYSKEEPGYLRGAAFDRYRNGNWLSEAPRDAAAPDPDAPLELSKSAEYPLYRLPANKHPDRTTEPRLPSADSWQMLDVWPTRSVSDAVFAPLEARWLSVPQPQLILDYNGIAYPEDQSPDTNYHAYRSSFSHESGSLISPIAPSGAESDPDKVNAHVTSAESINLASLTAIPENLDPRVIELSKTILEDCVTSDQKVMAVVGWFRKNYHYELGMKVPSGQDPLTHFLIRRPPAHCEYFATGTAVILRLGGVPCRYVTGFVSTEYNYLGGYWLVRNKDAHAWVEALLPGRGWVTVESTPSSGIPHSNPSIQPRHLWDDIVLRFQMLRSQLMQGTWRGLWRACRIIFSMLLTTPHGWLILCGCIIWIIVLLRRHIRFPFRGRLDPISTEFHRLLNELDRHLDRSSWRREQDETLHQFAARLAETTESGLQSAAGWYRSYADLRYRTDSSPEEFASLRAELPPIIAELKKPARQK